jgi:hypothetical protein
MNMLRGLDAADILYLLAGLSLDYMISMRSTDLVYGQLICLLLTRAYTAYLCSRHTVIDKLAEVLVSSGKLHSIHSTLAILINYSIRRTIFLFLSLFCVQNRNYNYFIIPFRLKVLFQLMRRKIKPSRTCVRKFSIFKFSPSVNIKEPQNLSQRLYRVWTGFIEYTVVCGIFLSFIHKNFIDFMYT